MSDTPKDLRQELDAAQRALAEAQTRCERHDAEHRVATRELEANRSALMSTLEDLEEARRKIEVAHREWMAALDEVKDPIFLHDEQFRILRCNKAYQQCAGIPFKQIIGRPYYEIFPKTGEPLPCCLRVKEKAGDVSDEEEMTFGDVIYRLRAFPVYDEQGGYLHSVHILEDITERKQSESNLKMFRILLDNSIDSIEVVDPVTLRFLDMNESGCRDLGYSREEILSMSVPDIDVGISMDSHKMIGAQLRQSGEARIESVHRRKNGSTFPVEVSSTSIKLDKPYVLSITRDITERRQAEAAITHANRALTTLSAVNRTLVRTDNEEELLLSICRAIVHQRGYKLAWVGYAQHDESKTIKIMAYASGNGGYPDTMQPSWSEKDQSGMEPSGRAIRSGTTQLCQDIANDPHYSPWREEALKLGYLSSIALALLDSDNNTFGTMLVYSNEVNAFTANEIDLLEEMAGDMAFGVRTLRVRHERDLVLEQNKRQVVQLQDNLEDTVRAIATIVEMRDPYTAGHESRVADLAAAIAKQMGLPDEQIHAIHLAGMVHDVGKINIPSEILSKPGRITDIELSLIKVHPQAGYDILKDVNFSWPIAQMVLQHHERLDGSGYPQGLKGEQIIMEARILSVADVVEAMSSHRPYRPGLGIDAALEEIGRKRGTHYDAQAVDACVALFKEQGYVIAR